MGTLNPASCCWTQSCQTKFIKQLNSLLEEFSDIMSKNSKDIGLTHLEEMVVPTEPGTAPVASQTI